MKRFLSLTLVLLLALVLLTACIPSPGGEPPPATLEEFLVGLWTSFAVVGVVLYFALEKVPIVSVLFDALGNCSFNIWKVMITGSEIKHFVVMILCMAFPLAALGLLVWLGYYEFTGDNLYTALSTGAISYMASQITHKRFNPKLPENDKGFGNYMDLSGPGVNYPV